MAKSKEAKNPEKTGSFVTQMIPLFLIGWIPSRNYARPEGTDTSSAASKGLAKSLAQSLWLSSQSVVVVRATAELVKVYVEEVTALLKRLYQQSLDDSKFAPAYEAARERYEKDGTIIVPEYIGVTGNCRNAVMPQAAIMWVTGDGKTGEESTVPKHEGKNYRDFYDQMVIKADVYDSLSTEEWVGCQIEENEKKNVGATAMGPAGLILTARKLLDLGFPVSKVRARFNDTNGARAAIMAILAQRFPNLDLFRIDASGKVSGRLVDTEHPKYIGWSKLNYGELFSLNWRSDPVALEERCRADAAKGIGKDDLPTLWLESDIDSKLEGYMGRSTAQATPKAVKAMPTKDVEALSKNNPNEAVKIVAEAVTTNNRDGLEKLNARALAMNALMALPVNPEFYGALDKLTRVSEEDRGAAIASFVSHMASLNVPAPTTETVSV